MWKTLQGEDVDSSLTKALQRAFEDTVQSSGKTIVQALLNTTRNHVQNRYPGSTHWNPEKIQPGRESGLRTGASGEIEVGVAGASRAYHDVTIRPIRAKMLTIPIHGASYGKRVSDFDNLFRIKGKNVLYTKDGGGNLVGLFALAKKAFQKQDKTLLPSDDTFVDNIATRFMNDFNVRLDKELQKMA